MIELDLFELVVVALALGVGSFVKGLTGTGLPQVAIPVMALAVGVERAVIIMSIPGVVSNLWLVWLQRRGAGQARDLPVLLATGIAGCTVGTVLLTTLASRWLSAALALLVLLYVVTRIRRPTAVLSARTSRLLSPPVGLLMGGLQGATGVSGPVVSTYLHSMSLAPAAYVFSAGLLFLVFSVTQVTTLAAIGAYTTTLFLEAVLALIPVAVMLPLGTAVSRRLEPATFSRIITVTLVVAALMLLSQALG